MKETALLRDLFISRLDTYCLQGRDGGYRRLAKPLSDDVVRQHLEGRLTLGCYQVDNKTNLVKYVCWDFDSMDKKGVLKLYSHLKNKGLEGFIEFSGNKGYHLWLFCEPVDAGAAKAFGEAVKQEAGVECEVFPKQGHVSEGEYGNFVKLPFGVHQKTGKRCCFLDEDFTPLPNQVALRYLEGIKKAVIKAPARSRRKRKVKPPREAPKCIARLLQGVRQGERDEAAFALARYYYHKGLARVEIEPLLLEWNQRNSPPLREGEIRAKVKSAQKGYGIGCSSPALRRHCPGEDACSYASGKGRGDKRKLVPISFYEHGSLIYEEVVRKEEAFPVFACWDGEKVEYLPDIEMGDFLYVPIYDDAVKEGAVLLPGEPLEYGSVESLIAEIKEHIHSYVDVSERFEDFAAWYVLLTWVYDRFNTLPYLRVLGDTGCGKSRFLDVVGRLCYKATIVSGAVTPAPIYRMIRRWRGTIVLDEADFARSDEFSEVVKILNCGFERNRPVIRSQRENPDNLQVLPTFCPKVFATRRRFKDPALESRCLTEVMTETTRSDIPYLLPRRFYEEEAALRSKLLMFRFRCRARIDPEKAQIIDLGEVEPRLKQATASFAALFANIPGALDEFRGFLQRYSQELVEERAQTYDGLIVNAIAALSTHRNVTNVTDVTLVPVTTSITPTDIAEYIRENHGLETNPRTVGRHLKSLGISVRVKKLDGRTRRCIVLDDKIQVLLKRYIANVTPGPVPEGASEVTKVTKDTETPGVAETVEGEAPDYQRVNQHELAVAVKQAFKKLHGAYGQRAAFTPEEVYSEVRRVYPSIELGRISSFLDFIYGQGRLWKPEPKKEKYVWVGD